MSTIPLFVILRLTHSFPGVNRAAINTLKYDIHLFNFFCNNSTLPSSYCQLRMTTKEYNSTIDQYADRVFAFVYKQLKDREQAQDIVQTVFSKMWEKVDTIDTSKAKSYLFTAAYHAIVDWSRRQKSKQKAMMHEEGGVELQDHSDELRVLLNQAVDTLPEVQKQLILLRDYEDYDYAQIAEITGLSDTQVRVYIFRARQTLKSLITQHWPS